VEFWGPIGGTFGDSLKERLEKVRIETRLFIEYTIIPGGWVGMMEKLNAAIAGRTVPDVAHIKDFSMKDYAWRGVVAKLDDYFAKGPLDPRKFRPSVWQAMQYKGNRYGAPWSGSFVHGLFINNELFQQAGLDPRNPPKTWDELVAVCRQLTDPPAGRWGHTFYELGTREYNLMLFSVYVGQCGGKIFSDDLSRVTLDTPAGNEALQWMYDMLWTWKLAVPPDQIDQRWGLVESGKVATWNHGAWYIWDARRRAPQLNFSLHQWPCYRACDNVDAPECVVMLQDVRDRALTWQAITLLVTPELDLELAGPRGGLPVFEENLRKGVFATDPEFKEYARIGSSKELRPRAWVEGYEEIAAVITPELQAVWFNRKSRREALAAAEQAGNAMMQRVRQR
jgi:multiple sugar transport system substrate-binding protein